MKLCRKCKGYGYLVKHRNKPLRICKRCDGWGKTDSPISTIKGKLKLKWNSSLSVN